MPFATTAAGVFCERTLYERYGGPMRNEHECACAPDGHLATALRRWGTALRQRAWTLICNAPRSGRFERGRGCRLPSFVGASYGSRSADAQGSVHGSRSADVRGCPRSLLKPKGPPRWSSGTGPSYSRAAFSHAALRFMCAWTDVYARVRKPLPFETRNAYAT